VWLDDCGKDGQINVNFRWDNDLAELRDRSVMTVDQAEERGRALLAAVRVARPRNGVPAKSRRR
jgi:predicted phosphoribosyltransferase